jgi:hypothetical protein
MKHPSIRQIFAYWDHRRRDRVAPERNEIEPGAIRQALGDSIILAGDGEGDLSFRLAGTRVCALFCRELKATALSRLWTDESRPLVQELVSTVTNEGIGVVGGVSAGAAGEAPIGLELLLLPLYFQQNLRTRLLGALAPLSIPHWLGIKPVGPLTLGAFRHLGPAITSARPLLPGLEAARMARGLRVFDGGLR